MPSPPIDRPTLTRSRAAAPTTVHEDTWLFRLDYKINEKTTLYGRAQRDISLVDAPNGTSVPGDKVRTINHPANYFIALAAQLLPEPGERGQGICQSVAVHQSLSGPPALCRKHEQLDTINNINSDIEVGTTYGVIDNLTWTRSRHTFKTGMEIRRIRLNQGKTADNNLSFADDSGEPGHGLR